MNGEENEARMKVIFLKDKEIKKKEIKRDKKVTLFNKKKKAMQSQICTLNLSFSKSNRDFLFLI